MKNTPPDKFDKRDLLRMTSVSCVSEPQQNALTFLKNNDLRSFLDLINTEDVETGARSLNHWINKPVDVDTGASLIETALTLGGRKQFVECLVNVGARLDIVSPASGFAPPHLVAAGDHIDLLRLFFKDQDECDVNIKAAEFQKCYSPLHVAAEKGSLEAMRFLLDFEEIDVDAKDIRGDTTPLLLAIKNKHAKAALMLIENGANVDTKVGRLTMRQFFQQNFPEVDLSPVKVKKRKPVMANLKDNVFKLLKETQLTDIDYNAKMANLFI